MNKKKISCSTEQLREVLESRAEVTSNEVDTIIDSLLAVTPSSSWWIVLLKVIAYTIGLILAGIGTVSAQCLTFIS